MSKKLYISVGLVIIIAAAVVFMVTREEDPQVMRVKEEILRAEAVLTGFRNTINAVPALELSEDVKNDFKMEANFFGLIGYLKAGYEGLPPRAMIYVGKLTMAADARAHPKLSFNMEDFGNTLETIAFALPDIANEDIKFLERLSDTFDEAVKRAKKSIPALAPLTMERNKKTERYFLEFDRLDQQLKAVAATLDKYSSNDFRAQLKKLKSANEVFRGLARYTSLLIEGKAGAYSLDVAKLFPEVQPMENAIKLCFRQQASCKQVGPFPGEQYQVMFQKLEPLYSALIEE